MDSSKQPHHLKATTINILAHFIPVIHLRIDEAPRGNPNETTVSVLIF